MRRMQLKTYWAKKLDHSCCARCMIMEFIIHAGDLHSSDLVKVIHDLGLDTNVVGAKSVEAVVSDGGGSGVGNSESSNAGDGGGSISTISWGSISAISGGSIGTVVSWGSVGVSDSGGGVGGGVGGSGIGHGSMGNSDGIVGHLGVELAHGGEGGVDLKKLI
ncbi:hypothetical protein B566_EDAN010255 [Ephemera danica]|nr:hypothetical protein B566_EDAN010255 [Ephemera danica]